jgi:membrane protease YdiL (CAAX protease family)
VEAAPRSPGRLRAWLGPWLSGLGGEPAVVLLGGSALLVISHHQGATNYWREVLGTRFDSHPWVGTMGHFYWFGASVFFYLLVPLLLSLVFRGEGVRRYGLGLGDWRAGLKVAGLFLLVMLPITAVAAQTEAFRGQYPLAGGAAWLEATPAGNVPSYRLFIAYELAYVAYFVAWEFFFRGWMLYGLLPTFGKAGAVLGPIAPFVLMHLGKSEPEALGSVVAGVALGLLSLRTRSIWYGVLVHATIAVWMDVLSARAYLPRL